MAVSVKIELGYADAASVAERKVQQALAWEAPQLSRPLRARVPRWSAGPTWTPPGTILLVRHRSHDGKRCRVTNSRIPPEGYSIEYDLGLVQCFAQPGTHRLVATDDGFFRTPFEGQLMDGLRSLGYVEAAPLPMLDALELRRDPTDGAVTLVAGPSDPLYAIAEPLGHLGYIESYPLNPREAPDARVVQHLRTLFRIVDDQEWRHHYELDEDRPSGAVALGGVLSAPRPGFIELLQHPDGRLHSQLLNPVPYDGSSLMATTRWVGAPLGWARRPRTWAMRATVSRVRTLARVVGERDSAGPEAAAIGFLSREPLPNWSCLFAARHPVIGDQYVTRSELEARDMGYVIDGVLGYVADWCADRSSADHPREVKWASRFGKTRRYIEGPHTS